MTSLIERHRVVSTLGISFLEEIANAAGTPFYAYDEDTLIRRYECLRHALPDDIDIYYSVKANPHPKVIGVLAHLVAGCEIASGGEFVLSQQAGVVPQRILFAGPGKGKEELEFVVAEGIREIHIESFDEIRVLGQITAHARRNIRVCIRINPAGVFGGGLMMGGEPTAFGFEEESLSEVLQALANYPRLQMRGIHIYTGTQILDAEVLLRHWHHAVDVAERISAAVPGLISTIDLGGGLGVPYFTHEKELDLEVLGCGAIKLVQRARSSRALAQVSFVVEPGRFLAGPAGIYVARVRSIKNCRGTTFVVLDGGMNHHLSASGNLGQVVRRDFPILNLSCESGPESTVTIVGPLCTPIDILGRKVKMLSPHVGDLIGILQSGAYGITASPVNFLSHPVPAEVLTRRDTFEIISTRQDRFSKPQNRSASAC